MYFYGLLSLKVMCVCALFSRLSLSQWSFRILAGVPKMEGSVWSLNLQAIVPHQKLWTSKTSVTVITQSFVHHHSFVHCNITSLFVPQWCQFYFYFLKYSIGHHTINKNQVKLPCIHQQKIKDEGYEFWQNTNTGLEQSTGTGMHKKVF